MTPTFSVNETALFTKHRENMLHSLSHRIAAAQATNDRPLVELLERERQQLAPTATPTGMVRSLDRGFQVLKQGVSKFLFGDTKLRVYQYSEGHDHWWYAFDPQTGDCVYADSEAELQRWIDENYHGN
jgi:hypothetical protein